MLGRWHRWFILLIVVTVLTLTVLPFIYAERAGGSDYNFGGFLLNPIDGNSYLAKMYLGWRGEWRFTLPYTAEPGTGAYLFLFYIFLGHVARLTGLSLILTFHLARAMCAVALLIAMIRFYSSLLPGFGEHRLAFTLSALGSGLGWLFAPFGVYTSDLWVAEAYPFLAAYANPHFPLGLAILLWILTPNRDREEGRRNGGWLVALSAFALGIILPFGIVVVWVVLGGVALWDFLEQVKSGEALRGAARHVAYGKLVWVVLGGGLILLYDVWVIYTDPILAGWNAQNLTPSPSLGNFWISFSPALIFAIPGVWRVWRQGDRGGRLLLVWTVLGVLLLYLPFGLQRRFITGLYIPLAGLAAKGLYTLTRGNPRRRFTLIAVLFLLATPTNLLVLLAANHGIQTHDARIFLVKDEVQAFQWIAGNTPRGAIILAAPETGLFIPAHTGRRVIYGHPFETLNARVMEARVERFFKGIGDKDLLMSTDFLFVGPREMSLGEVNSMSGVFLVFQNGSVKVYEIVKQYE